MSASGNDLCICSFQVFVVAEGEAETAKRLKTKQAELEALKKKVEQCRSQEKSAAAAVTVSP